MKFDQMKSKQGDLNPVDGNNLYREGLDPQLIGASYQGPLQQNAANPGTIHQNNTDFSNAKVQHGELSSAQSAK
tara:strand:+ start:259 stop:480 length:222 start_codon:yes stop_codon:yes gene_type:complete